MNSHENPEPHNPPQPTENHPPISKMNCFCLLSTIVVFLAISISFTHTDYFKTQFLRTTFSPEFTHFHKILKVFHSTQTKKQLPQAIPNSNRHCVLWMAPFLSGGGYSSEAWSYILALHENNKNPSFRLSIYQHGDLEKLEFWEGLPEKMRKLAIELYQAECPMDGNTIIICHSEPGAWYPPLFQTLPCPPTGYGHFPFVIGRTMFETDRLNTEHVRRCNRMDSIWVPTEFHVSTFVQNGVNSSKVVKIVQPVDIKFFDPFKCEPLDLGSAIPVLGSTTMKLSTETKFVFLSIFKWEYRKGWDVLLQAYLKEFSEVDGVALCLVTNPYHSDRDFGNKIIEFIENSDLRKPVGGWAPVYVIDTHIPQVDLPRLYKAANAFVLPSRGEGWGRPLVEAMAMSLPVITTNWSGPTEYITEENSYPLAVDILSEVSEGPFRGHLWAEPSVSKLRVLMRHVTNNPEEAKARGRKARQDMISRFSPEIVAGILTHHLQQIFDKVV